MPDVAEQPTKPPRTWRPMAVWTAGILLVLGLAWLIVAFIIPIVQTCNVLRDYGQLPPMISVGERREFVVPPLTANDVIHRLGGQARATSRIRTYLGLPSCVAPYRREACQLLGYCGRPAVPVLVELLNRTDTSSPIPIIKALGEIGPEAEEAVPALMQQLTDNCTNETRVAAAFALRKIGRGAAPAVPLLVRMLDDADLRKSKAPFVALGSVGPGAEEAIPALVLVLTDKDGYVRAAAAHALTRIGPNGKSAALSELIRILNSGETIASMEAATTLGEMGSAAAVAIPDLERALTDEHECVRQAAAEALKRIRGEEPPK